MQTRRWEGILSVYPCIQRGGECLRDNLSNHSQGAEGQLACECSVIWMPSDRNTKLKYHTKNKTKQNSSFSNLTASFAVEEAITLSWSLAVLWQSVSQIIFPQDILHQSGTGQKSSYGGMEERKGRISLRAPCFYPQLINHIKDLSMEGMTSWFVIFPSLHYWWIPALTSNMKFLFCSCLENVAIWDFCFGPAPFDPAFVDKKSLLTAAVGVKVTGLGVLF